MTARRPSSGDSVRCLHFPPLGRSETPISMLTVLFGGSKTLPSPGVCPFRVVCGGALHDDALEVLGPGDVGAFLTGCHFCWFVGLEIGLGE